MSFYQLSLVKEQKRQIIKKLMNKKLRNGDTWYLIDTKWFNQWKKFVGYDSWDTSFVGHVSAHPGAIDNSSLTSSSGDLKEHLLEGLNYQVIPTECWYLFLSWYGMVEGQQPIARKVIEQASLFVRYCKVEVYLMNFKLCLYNNQDNIIIKPFSCGDKIEHIKDTMKSLFQISAGKNTRLWIEYMSNTFQPVDRLENTVSDVGLSQGQLIVMEVQNDDGTWPKSFQQPQNQTELQQVAKPKAVKARPATVNSDKQLRQQDMRVKSDNTSNNSMEQMITCVICLEVMVKPLMLPCMHSFCKACLKKLNKVRKRGKEGFNCPTCRVFASETDLKKDFRVLELIEIYRSSTHPKTLKMSDSKMCENHPLFAVKAVCTQCNVVICSECKFRNHDTHPSEAIETAVEKLLPSVSDKIEILAKKVDEMKSRLQAVEDKKRKISCTKEVALCDIQKQKEIVQEKLDAEFSRLSLDVSNLNESLEKDLDSKANVIRQSIEEVQSVITDVNNAMAESKDIDFFRSLQDSHVKCDEMLRKNGHKEFNIPSDDEPLNVHFEKIEINSPLLGNLTDIPN